MATKAKRNVLQEERKIEKAEKQLLKEEKKIEQKLNNKANAKNALLKMARQEINKRQGRKPQKYQLGAAQTSMQYSRDLLLNTLFCAEKGISRGMAWGLQTTALARFKTFVDVSIPAGTYLNYILAPAQASSANWFAYSYGTGSTTINNPYATGANITNAAVAGFFNSLDPSVGWRVVRTAMRFTPTGTVTNQGGEQFHAYHPNLYNGSPSLVDLTQAVTASLLTNMEMSVAFGGYERTILQWVPNDNEIYVENTGTYSAATTETSTFVGYVFVPTTTTFRIDFDIGIEYIPNAAYRPYVDRALPSIKPDTWFDVNQVVAKDWMSLMIMTYPKYEALCQTFNPVQHHWTYTEQVASSVGAPSLYANLGPIGAQEDGLLDKLLDYGKGAATDFVATGAKKVLGAVLEQGLAEFMPI